MGWRAAIITVTNADAGVQAVTGRATHNLIPWANIREEDDAYIAYTCIDESATPQEGEQRAVEVQFSCFAWTIGEAETLAARVTSEGASGMLTHTKLAAQGMNMVPIRFFGQRDMTELEEDGRKGFRVDVSCEFEVEYA